MSAEDQTQGRQKRLNVWYRLAIVVTALWLVLFPVISTAVEGNRDTALREAMRERCLDEAIDVKQTSACFEIFRSTFDFSGLFQFKVIEALVLAALAWMIGLVAVAVTKWVLAGRRSSP